MVTHRFPLKADDSRFPDPILPFHPCQDDDGNVDNEQAHALYLASKQRTKDNSQQDVPNSKPTTKMKRISRH